MKNVTMVAFLPSGEHAPIETHHVLPDGYWHLFQSIKFQHPEAAQITHDLELLVHEGAEYFDPGEEPAVKEESFIHWITVRSKRGKPHTAGIIEWSPISSQEVAILNLYVMKAFRRRGLATALLAEAVRHIMNQRYQSILVRPQKQPYHGKEFMVKNQFSQTVPGTFRRNLQMPGPSSLSEELDSIVIVKY